MLEKKSSYLLLPTLLVYIIKLTTSHMNRSNTTINSLTRLLLRPVLQSRRIDSTGDTRCRTDSLPSALPVHVELKTAHWRILKRPLGGFRPVRFVHVPESYSRLNAPLACGYFNLCGALLLINISPSCACVLHSWRAQSLGLENPKSWKYWEVQIRFIVEQLKTQTFHH